MKDLFRIISHRFQKNKRQSISVLAIIITFVMVYSLIMPAVAIERDAAEKEPGLTIEETASEGVAAEAMAEAEPASLEAEESSVEADAAVESEPVAEEPAAEEPAAEEIEDEAAAPAAAPAETSTADDSYVAADTSAAQQSANTGAAQTVTGAAQADENKANADGKADPSASDTKNSDAEEEMPAQNFEQVIKYKEIIDEDGNTVEKQIKVVIDAAKDTFPAGTTMKAELILNNADVEKAVEDAVKQAAGDLADATSIVQYRAVDITFADKDGQKIEPAKKVEVRITSDKIAEIVNPMLVHVNVNDQNGRVINADVFPKNDVSIIDEKPDTIDDNENTMLFKASRFSPYVIVESQTIDEEGDAVHGLNGVEENADNGEEATDGENGDGVLIAESDSYTVTIKYDEAANIPEDAEIDIKEIPEASRQYQSYMGEAEKLLIGDANENGENASGSKEINYAKIVDVNIVSATEGTVTPEADIDVDIAYKETEEIAEGTVMQALSFNGRTPEVEKDALVYGGETYVDGLQVTTDKLPVYGIVGTETITTHVITAEGETYEISVTYGQDADIPVDASLNAVEILEGTDAYNQYLSASAEQLMVADEDVHFARFFDVQIKKDEQIIEPKAPVEVKITYSAGISIEDGNELSVVHFAEDGIEIISDLGINDDNTEITYQQDSFSVIGTVTTTPTEGWPDNGDYIMVVTSNNTPGRYYAVSYTGRLMEVEYNPTTREVTFPYFLRTDQLNGYTWSISGNAGRQRQVSSNGWYLDPRAPGNNNTNWSRVGTYYSRVPLNTTARSVSRTDNGTLQGVNNNGNTNGYYLTVSPEGSSASATLNLQIAASNSSSVASRATVYFASKSSFKVDEEEIPDPDHPQPEPDLDDIGDAPGHQKKLIDNENGTYTLSLDVQGKADSGKGGGGANVIIVYDYSGSMDQTMAGGNRRRIEVARDVVKQLADDLIPDPATSSDKIWFNLVPFSNTAQTPGQWTNNKTSFLQRVNSYNPSQYTDWTGAMRRTANMSVPDNGFPTYVIFVTDGQPSGYSDSENTRHEQSGSYHSAAGTSDVTDPCYYNAIPGAQQLVEKGYFLYGVFIGSDDTNMVANLIHDAGEDPDEYSYKASTVSAFEEVFAKISAEIKASISFDDVAIIDTMTDATSSTVIAAGSTAEDYSYFITKNGTGYEIVLNDDGNISNIYNATIGSNGKATRGTSAGNAVTIEDDKGNSLELVVGNPFPKAGSSGDTVTWDIGELGVLLNDYSYTVQFVVWPNQDAYDTVAGLNNGTIQWSQVDQTQYTRNTTTTPTSYGLRTNIEEESKVTFKKTKITQTGDDDPVIEEETGSSKYTPPTPVPLVNHKIIVEKTFEDSLYGTEVPSTIQLVVNRDTDEYATIDLTKEGNIWKGELFIAPGLKVDGEVLDTGYDYSVAREIVKSASGSDISYRYELISGTFHPMLIDSATVITDESGQSGTLAAENHARGFLELKKEIRDIDDPTTEFTLCLTRFVDKNGNQYSDEIMSDIWAVIYTGDDPYAAGSSFTWYPLSHWYNTDSGQYSIVLKEGETFRIGSVPIGTQYTVMETNVPSSYEFVGFREDTTVRVDDQLITTEGDMADESNFSGMVDSANKGYAVVCVNTLADRQVKIRKIDNTDSSEPLKDAVFSMVINDTTYILTSNDDGFLEFTGKYIDGDAKALEDGDPSGVLTSLKAGEYTLIETDPPAGYVSIEGRIDISIGESVTAGSAIVKAFDDNDQEITDEGAEVSYYIIYVKNAPGHELPMTGGPGTLIYTLSGLALIFASALMYGFRMRRRERRLN